MAKAKAKTKQTAQDLRAKSDDELKKQLVDLKKQQLNLRFQKSGGQLTNTAEIRAVRREVARVKTIVGQKKTGAAAPAKAKAAKPAAKAKAKKAATA